MQTKEDRVIELDPEARRLVRELARSRSIPHATEQQLAGYAIRELARHWKVKVRPIDVGRKGKHKHEDQQLATD